MKIFLSIRWLIPVMLVGYVAGQALFAQSPLTATTNFIQRTPYFDVLLPAGRVERSAAGVVLKEEPVYIDARLPIRTSQLRLEVSVSVDSAPLKIGLQTQEGFNFLFSDIEPVVRGDEKIYYLEVPKIYYQRPAHKVRFIISVPNFRPSSVWVRGASINFQRQSLTLQEWRELIRSSLWR